MTRRLEWFRRELLPWCMAWLAAASCEGRADWRPTVSTYRGEFHRFSPVVPGREGGEGAWTVHEVSRNMVEWSNAGVALPGEPMGRVLGACATEARAESAGGGRKSRGSHAVMALVESGGQGAALCLFRSEDGRRYERHAGNPVLKVAGASGAAPTIVWDASSSRWVLGMPVRDARGAGLQLHGSTNLVNWSVLGRVDGDHDGGGLAELPVRGSKGATALVLADSGGRLVAGSIHEGSFVPDMPRLAAGHGDLHWEFPPVPGVRMPDARRLAVARGRGGLGWEGALPWQVSLEQDGAASRIIWEPAVEAEALRVRTRLMEVARLSKAGTNELVATLPEQFELRLELPDTPHLRMTLRIGSDHVRFSVPDKMLVLNGTTNLLGPMSDMGRWVIRRVPGRLDLMVSEGRFRASVPSIKVGAPGRIVVERPGGWWLRFPYFALHELRKPTPSQAPAQDP